MLVLKMVQVYLGIHQKDQGKYMQFPYPLYHTSPSEWLVFAHEKIVPQFVQQAFALTQWASMPVQMTPMPFQLNNELSFYLAHVSFQLAFALAQWALMPVQVAFVPFSARQCAFLSIGPCVFLASLYICSMHP